MVNTIRNYIIIILPVLLSIFFFRNNIEEFPSHIHAWAQADRYALALGFLNNGFDFFHPQTYNLNLQFPSKLPLQVEQGITAVDFPIHEYIVALIMKITGNRDPVVFRLYSLMYGLAGLFFLYRLSRLFINNSILINIIVLLFAFTAPVYTYYMDGFIPSVTSLANCFIAYYFYFKYKKENQLKDFCRGVFFITLAALSRTPFAVFLIAMICGQSFSYFIKKKISWKEAIAFVISITCLAGYFLYNAYLRNKYGSVFLSSVFPAKNMDDLKIILKTIYDRWFFQYFTPAHYFVLAVAILASAASTIKFRYISAFQKQLLFQIIITGTGSLIYFLLMATQYREHDYYFLDSFFTVVILLLVFFSSMIKFRINKYVMPAITFTAISFFIIQSFRVQAMRNENNSWDRYEATADNFKGADKFLDKNNVPAKARILVIDAYTPNIPFILMNRKGYSVITTSREEILKALNYKFDYVVINNRFLLSDVLNNYPGLKNYLDPVDDNGKITLYNYSKTEKKKSLMEFLGLDKRTPQTDATINFGDSIHSVYWENTDKRIDKMICDFDYGQTGKWSAYIDSANEYGATFHIAASQLNTATSHLVLFEGEFCSGDSLRDMLIAGYAGHDNTVSYQQYYDLSTQVKERNKWTRVEFLFSIDKIESTDEIKVFIWNPKKKFSCYNNLRVRVY